MSAQEKINRFKDVADADKALRLEEKREERRVVQRDWQCKDDNNEYNREWAQSARARRLRAALGDPYVVRCVLCGYVPSTVRRWVLFDWDLLPDKLFLKVAEKQEGPEACVCRRCYFKNIIKCNQ